MTINTTQNTMTRADKLALFATVLALIAAFGVSVSVYIGALDLMESDSDTAKIRAAILALVSGVLFGGLWHAVFEYAAKARGVEFAIAPTFGVLLFIAALKIIVVFTVVALAGPQAVQIHERRGIETFEQALEDLSFEMNQDAKLIPQAEALHSNMGGFQNGERNRGIFTETPGTGRIFELLGIDVQNTSDAVDAMNATFTRRTNNFAEAREAIHTAKAASNTNDSEGVTTALNEAIKYLSEAKTMSLTDLVGNIQIGQGALSQYRQVSAAADPLYHAARELDRDRKRISLPTWAPMTRTQAVKAYREEVSWAWSVPVGIEAILLLFLCLILAKAYRDSQTPDPVAEQPREGPKEQIEEEIPAEPTSRPQRPMAVPGE